MEFDQPLRILHLASSERWTGAAEPAANLAAYQQSQGHSVAFVCIGGSSFERRLGALGLPFVPGFHFNRRVNLAQVREDVRNLRAYVLAHRPDVIHCHLPHDHWTAALALRRPFVGKPALREAVVIRTMHRERPPREDIPHRWLVGKGTDLVITVSASNREALINHVGLPPSKVMWVRGAVNLEKFQPGLDPSLIRKIYNMPLDAHVAGMIARMQPHRGHHLLLDTLDEVVARVPQAYIALAGRGEIKNELVERIGKHPLTSHLKRIGYRKYDLPETYAAMDVVVLMVPGSDGSCRAMLEAMACGRPVIGSRQGAMRDAIEPGVNGWLFEPNDRAGLTGALIEALSDLDRLREMGIAARKFVEETHSIDAQYRHTLEVYREAMNRRRKVLGLAG